MQRNGMSIAGCRLPGAFGLLPILFVAAAFAPAGAQGSGTLFGQTRQELAARRAAVRAAFPGEVVLFCGPGDNGDVGRVRFRTSDNVMYLTGVEAPDACLALLPDADPSGRREILFVPGQSPGARQWNDPLLEPGEAAVRVTGIESVRPTSGMWDELSASFRTSKGGLRLESPGELAGRLLPDGSEVGPTARYNPFAVAVEQAKRANPSIKVQSGAEQAVYRLRRTKSAGEMANIRSAIAATGAAERSAAQMIRPGVSEIAVEGAILAAFRRGGAVREAFPSIVGSGPNSTVLHHFAGSRQMAARDTVVVDIGAEYDYYAADITRTFPAGGRFTPRQRQLYRLVLATQQDAFEYARPGMMLSDLNAHAKQYLRSSAVRARDLDGKEHTMDFYFVHALGHFLGMDVHDVTAGSLRLDPGVVFTIEPGVYIPSEGIGIRIEDDYLVTPDRIVKLSANIPSGVAEVESMMKMRPAAAAPGARRIRRAGRR